MKFRFPDVRIFFVPIVSLCSFIACSSSSGIDDYYTFNVVKSQVIPVPAQVPVEQNVSGPFLITFDSTDLVTSKTLETTIPLTKSVKMNKLAFSSSDPSYPMTSFDTVMLVISADSLADQLLATYSGSADSVYLTNADIAAYVKKPSSHYTVTFRANTAPAKTENIAASCTFVFTALPVQ
jgi:hypothetical protein